MNLIERFVSYTWRKRYNVDFERLKKIYNPKDLSDFSYFLTQIGPSIKAQATAKLLKERLNIAIPQHKATTQETYELLAFLLRETSLNKIHDGLVDAKNYNITLPFFNKQVGFDLPVIKKSGKSKLYLQDEINMPFLLVARGYSHFNKFLDDYGQTIFEAVVRNRAYHTSDIDYSAIGSYPDFLSYYYSDKLNPDYGNIVLDFNRVMVQLLTSYSAEHLTSDKESICHRIKSGYIEHQLVGSLDCQDNGKLNEYIDSILSHFKKDYTLQFLIEAKLKLNALHAETRCPLEWYASSIEQMLKRPKSLTEAEKKNLVSIRDEFNLIASFINEKDYEGLYLHICEVDSEKDENGNKKPSFEERIEQSIVQFHDINKRLLALNVNDFSLEHRRAFTGNDGKVILDDVVCVDSYEQLKNSIIVPFSLEEPREYYDTVGGEKRAEGYLMDLESSDAYRKIVGDGFSLGVAVNLATVEPNTMVINSEEPFPNDKKGRLILPMGVIEKRSNAFYSGLNR